MYTAGVQTPSASTNRQSNTGLSRGETTTWMALRKLGGQVGEFDVLRDHTLVREWLSRLRPASTARRDEVGYQLALSMLPIELGPNDHLAPTGFFVDTESPHCWIVSSGETVIATCGTSVPARGVLRQAYLAEGAVFFLDSSGVTWPLKYKPPGPANTDEDLPRLCRG